MEKWNQNVKSGNGKVKNKKWKGKWHSENQNVKNENGKIKNKNRNLNRKAKWRGENQKVKNKNEISMCPPPPLRVSVGFTKDIVSTFLFSWTEVMLVTPLYTCIQATIFKSLNSDFQTV